MGKLLGLENVIKFSHHYDKFDGVDIEKPVTLLQVFKCRKEDLSNIFIEYDTSYHKNKEKLNYELSDDDLLVLLFIDSGGCLFTTVRRWYPTKENYYKNLIGQKFKIKQTE